MSSESNSKLGECRVSCQTVIQNSTEITEIKRRMNSYEETIKSILIEIRELRDILLNRPSWKTSLTITTLVGFLVSCIMWIVTHIK